MTRSCNNDRLFTLLLILLVILLLLVNQSTAFGAGNIPSYSHLEDKAFRHGDIEDVLSELSKKVGSGVLACIGSKKFGGLDIKRIYFGNWLRDYSQAMDVAGLSKLARQTIINLVMALGFLAHGYATGEFEVTEERLGVYLPVEHIDNPKGYNDGQDARKIHPGLRGPVDPQELQIDPRTGMKNYIANESGTWDTSAACVRRTLLQCIDIGRRAKSTGEADSHEAYRLLGTALHTLEDLTAHSNWCELSLRRLGHAHVFCHVGDACLIETPSGRAPPLVTGVFGSADFLHSLLGEATDHISEASVSDLTKAMNTARSAPGSDPTGDGLRSLLFQMPPGGGTNLSREMDELSDIRSRSSPGSGFDPAQMSPQELHATLWKVLKFRDNVCKSIEKTIEKIPGLSTLTEKIGNAVNKFVFTTLEPYLKPIMVSATDTLQTGSAAVINKQDQYETFDNPRADDPTHSLLSKDHFGLILNEPAGNLAKIIVKHAVKGIVQAWDSSSVNPHQAVNKILEAFHHPYFVDGSSDVQREMGAYMRDWIGNMPEDDRRYVLSALSKDSVRQGKNKRRGYVDNGQQGCCGGHGSSTFGQHMQGIVPNSSQIASQISNHMPAYNPIHSFMPGSGRDLNANPIPSGSYDQPSNAYGGGRDESRPSHAGGGMIMPEADCPNPMPPVGFEPGPGGFAMSQPSRNNTLDVYPSEMTNFGSHEVGPPPIRHDSYPTASQNGPHTSYAEQFPAAFNQPNAYQYQTWNHSDQHQYTPQGLPHPSWAPADQRPPPQSWAPADQRPPPPQSWAPSDQCPPPPQLWAPAEQRPPPPQSWAPAAQRPPPPQSLNQPRPPYPLPHGTQSGYLPPPW